ncbi:MAG: superoxide dismutase family protein [Rhodospirillaceae bacterium]|nr:superoxide dismutase family protein [Rhodospirillaceae bacterium]
MTKLIGATVLAAGIALVATSQLASAAEQASAAMMNANGESVGAVTLRETPQGTLLHAKLEILPAGAHAFHIHAVGACEPPFKSAGGHFNPTGKKHGIDNPEGMHVGDMPNIHVPESGALEIEVLNAQLRLDASLFDEDGAAIVIHEGPDDYVTDPAGAAGPRIACGVITQ